MIFENHWLRLKTDQCWAVLYFHEEPPVPSFTQTRTRGQLPVNLQLALGSRLPFSQNSWLPAPPNIGQEQVFGFPRPDPWFIYPTLTHQFFSLKKREIDYIMHQIGVNFQHDHNPVFEIE